MDFTWTVERTPTWASQHETLANTLTHWEPARKSHAPNMELERNLLLRVDNDKPARGAGVPMDLLDDRLEGAPSMA